MQPYPGFVRYKANGADTSQSRTKTTYDLTPRILNSEKALGPNNTKPRGEKVVVVSAPLLLLLLLLHHDGTSGVLP